MDEQEAFVVGVIAILGFFSFLALLSFLTHNTVIIPGLGEITLLNAIVLIIVGIIGAIVAAIVFRILDGLGVL